MFTVIEEIDLTSIRVWNAAIRGISQCEHTDGDLKMLGRTSHFLILFTLLKSGYVQEKRCFVFASKTTSILRFLNDGLKGLFWLLKHFSLLIAATVMHTRGYWAQEVPFDKLVDKFLTAFLRLYCISHKSSKFYSHEHLQLHLRRTQKICRGRQ